MKAHNHEMLRNDTENMYKKPNVILSLLFRQEFTVETFILEAWLTRWLEMKSSPISGLVMGEVWCNVAYNLSQSKPALMNMATKTRGKTRVQALWKVVRPIINLQGTWTNSQLIYTLWQIPKPINNLQAT